MFKSRVSIKNEKWRLLAREIGGEIVERGSSVAGVNLRVGNWTIKLDSYSWNHGGGGVGGGMTGAAHGGTSDWTRITLPYISSDGFQFTLHRRPGILGTLGWFKGRRTVFPNNHEFYRQFHITTTDWPKMHALLENPNIRTILWAQRHIFLKAQDVASTNSSHLEYEGLYFQDRGFIWDVPRLKSLFELIQELVLLLAPPDPTLKQRQRPRRR